ncbi:UNVERIFIED_CONTAM: hypothetical protein GTU68_041960, partial [Idotea baltica]|nr:hypothetical protein [Idotea baltica]
MYWDADIDSSALSGKTVTVLGYGSQGRGQALNLRDSGLNVVVGLRENGPTWKLAESDGFTPLTPENAVAKADLVAMLVPDLAQASVYESAVKDNLKDGATLLFSHGFNIHFGQIVASDSIDVVMIAPKGPGRLVRRTFEEGGGVPCLVAVDQDSTGSAKQRALAYGQALGGGKAGIIETTFAEETETDLFGEQAVLCGGATELIKAG